jgi:hypothetical protein
MHIFLRALSLEKQMYWGWAPQKILIEFKIYHILHHLDQQSLHRCLSNTVNKRNEYKAVIPQFVATACRGQLTKIKMSL